MTTAQTKGEETPAPVPINVVAQYVKDFSFENPNAPQIFAPNQGSPELSMGVNLHTRAIAENNYEVLLALKLEAKLQGKQAFIGELVYGGVFVLPPMPEEQLRFFLLVEGPRLLFPYARSILSGAIRDGGFPQVMINPIDFMGLYVANKDSLGSMPTAGAA